MSHTLTIKKNGIIYKKKWIYDNVKGEGEYAFMEVLPDEIFSELNVRVEELEEGFTLRDYFRMVIYYEKLMCLDNYFPVYIDEYLNCPTENCICEDMPYLSLSRLIMVEQKDGVTNEIQDYFDFCGEKNIENEPKWAIELSKLNTLLDTPLKIGEINVYVENYEADGYRPLNSVTYKYKKENIKLFDFVTEIIWELSFFGTPVERDIKSEELDDMFDKIKEKDSEWNEASE